MGLTLASLKGEEPPEPQHVRVKALARVEITVDVVSEALDYAAVTDAVQTAIGHTGAQVVDVDEYEQVN